MKQSVRIVEPWLAGPLATTGAWLGDAAAVPVSSAPNNEARTTTPATMIDILMAGKHGTPKLAAMCWGPRRTVPHSGYTPSRTHHK